MAKMMKRLVGKLAARPKWLFLADAIGALLTAFLLGVVLVKFHDRFGMPKHVLFILSAIACMYMLYSFCCAMLITGSFRPWLKIIAIANILYACLTAALVIYHSRSLTALGWSYFLLELAVMAVLVAVELRVPDSIPTNYP